MRLMADNITPRSPDETPAVPPVDPQPLINVYSLTTATTTTTTSSPPPPGLPTRGRGQGAAAVGWDRAASTSGQNAAFKRPGPCMVPTVHLPTTATMNPT
ncbi:unnamed protein product [Gadus morhua 'NCC']